MNLLMCYAQPNDTFICCWLNEWKHHIGAHCLPKKKKILQTITNHTDYSLAPRYYAHKFYIHFPFLFVILRVNILSATKNAATLLADKNEQRQEQKKNVINKIYMN